jgi:hypothetical protein
MRDSTYLTGAPHHAQSMPTLFAAPGAGTTAEASSGLLPWSSICVRCRKHRLAAGITLMCRFGSDPEDNEDCNDSDSSDGGFPLGAPFPGLHALLLRLAAACIYSN